MKAFVIAFFLLGTMFVFGQAPTEQERFIARIGETRNIPDGIVSARSAVLFSGDYQTADLDKIQKGFQQTGIDAVTYLSSDIVLAGPDIRNGYAVRFNKRDIKFLILATKDGQEFQFRFIAFNPKNWWSNPKAWIVRSANLQDLLIQVFRALAGNSTRQNFLINDYPEMEPVKGLFTNNRNESMISGLKTLKVALTEIGSKEMNKELSDYFTNNFHGRFELTPDTLSERELAQKGYRFVLRYVHAPGTLAKGILGFEVNKSESAITSVTYSEGSLQLKTIPAGNVVYKFYFKDLEDRNIFLGTKWDADIRWQDALKNHMDAYRTTGRIN